MIGWLLGDTSGLTRDPKLLLWSPIVVHLLLLPSRRIVLALADELSQARSVHTTTSAAQTFCRHLWPNLCVMEWLYPVLHGMTRKFRQLRHFRGVPRVIVIPGLSVCNSNASGIRHFCMPVQLISTSQHPARL